MTWIGIEGVSETPSCLRRAEEDLLEGTGGAGCVWIGRAATALYLAYRLARRESTADSGPEIILPSMCCATPANVAYLAGCVPRFADVEPHTGLLSLESIQGRYTPRTRAVVFVHLFGQTADLAPIAQWCRARRILFIEDAAQAQGARLADGRAVGSAGDACVYSFNPPKILAGGGGAITVRSQALAALLEDEIRCRPLPPQPPADVASQLALSYRNLHHGLAGLLRLRPACRIADWFLRVRGEYDDLCLRPMQDPTALGQEWERIAARLEHRRALAEIYSQALAGGPWRLLDGWRSSGVCWRYSLLVDFPHRVVSFCEAVRRDGFHVSNLYWPLHDFFAPHEGCPCASEFGRRIVNLWVDASITAEAAVACAASVRRHAEALNSGGDRLTVDR
jgi:dTDP-4-amino-4,6-dideoxygalactose transaminase